MIRTARRRLHLLGSSTLLTLTVLLAACGGESVATSAPAATATRAAGTATAAVTNVAGAATSAAGASSPVAGTAQAAGSAAVSTGNAAASTAIVAGSATVATGTSAAATATGTRIAATTTGAASTGTSAALPTTAPMPLTPGATSAATAAGAVVAPAGTVTGATTGGAAASPAAAGSAPSAGAVRYAIGMGSEGSYTVNEKFANLPAPNDAVGKTDQVTGTLVLGPNGQVIEGGRVVVNIQSLMSDRMQRDNYLRNTSLESSKFPEAIFVIRMAEGLNAPLGAAPVNFQLMGDLTLHGVTRPVVWNATATQGGDTINGTATLTVRMQDFMITPPMVAILTTSDMAKLDLKIVARRMP